MLTFGANLAKIYRVHSYLLELYSQPNNIKNITETHNQLNNNVVRPIQVTFIFINIFN